jgi:hypothetical protein
MVRTHVSPSQVAAGKAHERAKHGDGQLGAKPPNRPPLQRYYSCRTGKQAKQSKATPVRLRRPHAHGTEAESRVLPLASRRADGRRAVRGTLSDPRARERQARFGRASGPARPCAGEAAVAPCRAYPFLFSPPSSSSVL